MQFPTDISGPILYQLHKGESKKAFEHYLSYSQESSSHDYELLQKTAINLLEQGIKSKDPEIELMCMFGAGISTSHDLLPILEKGISSSETRTQLIALSYLSRSQDDQADRILLKALSSPFVLPRLEACYQLAKKKHPSVLTHLQSLTVKVPFEIRALLPQIAIYLDDPQGNAFFRHFLADESVDVRIEAIKVVAQANRDDFLPQIRGLLSEAHFAQQESCAYALGKLKDSHSIESLKKLLVSRQREVRLAAASALAELGEQEGVDFIKQEAKRGDLFAITALGEIEEIDLLKELLTHASDPVRLNAFLALLPFHEIALLPYLPELLFPKENFAQITSPGRTLQAWKKTQLVGEREEALTFALREKVLIALLEYPEETLLQVAEKILLEKKLDLIPLLMQLLENHASPAVVAFLKEKESHAKAPLIRHYCTLTLFRMKEAGPYEEKLLTWVKQSVHHPLIRFKSDTEKNSSLTLNPEETSKFLVEAIETLSQTQGEAVLNALLHAIAYGNEKNRYALAGLLLRVTE